MYQYFLIWKKAASVVAEMFCLQIRVYGSSGIEQPVRFDRQ